MIVEIVNIFSLTPSSANQDDESTCCTHYFSEISTHVTNISFCCIDSEPTSLARRNTRKTYLRKQRILVTLRTSRRGFLFRHFFCDNLSLLIQVKRHYNQYYSTYMPLTQLFVPTLAQKAFCWSNSLHRLCITSS